MSTSPDERLVINATSEALMVADWGANLELSDRANSSAENAKSIAKAVVARLQSLNQKVVQLAVTLLDTLFKNGSTATVQNALAVPSIQTALKDLCAGKRGPDCQAKAAALVQELGIAWARVPSLPWAALYSELRMGGAVAFPKADEAAIASMFSNLNVISSSSATAQQQGSGGQQPIVAAEVAAALPRIQEELNLVRTRVSEAARLLVGGGVLSTRPDFLDLMDFCEQVAARLRGLVEAGINGLLDESLFEETLAVNDAVARVLEAGLPVIRQAQATGGSASAPTSVAPMGALQDLTTFNVGGLQHQQQPSLSAGPSSTATDLLGLQQQQPSGAAPGKNEKAPGVYNPFDFADFHSSVAPPPPGGASAVGPAATPALPPMGGATAAGGGAVPAADDFSQLASILGASPQAGSGAAGSTGPPGTALQR